MSIIVETDRLIARYWRVSDAADAFAIYGDPEVTRNLGGNAHDSSIEETEAWIVKKVETQTENAPRGLWAVEERATGRVVGHALLEYATINGENRIELGYAFAHSAWCKGYATELSHALLRVGFDTLGLDEIYGVVMPENAASRRVLEKIGMRNLGMGDYNGFPIEVLVIRSVDRS